VCVGTVLSELWDNGSKKHRRAMLVSRLGRNTLKPTKPLSSSCYVTLPPADCWVMILAWARLEGHFICYSNISFLLEVFYLVAS
jgi:hypothetical protein